MTALAGAMHSAGKWQEVVTSLDGIKRLLGRVVSRRAGKHIVGNAFLGHVFSDMHFGTCFLGTCVFGHEFLDMHFWDTRLRTCERGERGWGEREEGDRGDMGFPSLES